jgi:hypothetical protein
MASCRTRVTSRPDSSARNLEKMRFAVCKGFETINDNDVMTKVQISVDRKGLMSTCSSVQSLLVTPHLELNQRASVGWSTRPSDAPSLLLLWHQSSNPWTWNIISSACGTSARDVHGWWWIPDECEIVILKQILKPTLQIMGGWRGGVKVKRSGGWAGR